MLTWNSFSIGTFVLQVVCPFSPSLVGTAARTFAEDPSPPKLAEGFKPVQLPLVEILQRPA